MRRKVLISQVSKLWRDITVEFLFNSIRIHHGRQIPLLGMAFNADEQRKNAQPGSAQRVAACWVREIWFDLGHLPSTSSDFPSELDIAGLFQRCPDVVVLRGFGQKYHSKYQPGAHKNGQIIKYIVATTSSPGPVAYSSLNHQEGRKVEISRLVDYDPFIPLVPQPFESGRWFDHLYIHRLQSLELHPSARYYHNYSHTFATVCLPELTHLFIRGLWGTAQYARCLEMPSIRSLAYDAIANTHRPTPDPFQVLMEKHGAKLKELALLHEPCQEELLQVQEHCTNLDTMYTHWAGAGFCPPTVTTVGLFGLESVVFEGSDDRVLTSLAGLIGTAVALHEVRDMSWRSGFVRQRAARSRNDPAASIHRKFWAKFVGILHSGGQEVQLVDWRGREIHAERYELGPGEDEMDEDDRGLERLAAGRG
ncbi:hypothetical protein FRC00_008195 [Tulasnella sp. 408]|nr:hypothetical protein FRC00_008195 [Tulasnella sp. 408]